MSEIRVDESASIGVEVSSCLDGDRGDVLLSLSEAVRGVLLTPDQARRLAYLLLVQAEAAVTHEAAAAYFARGKDQAKAQQIKAGLLATLEGATARSLDRVVGSVAGVPFDTHAGVTPGSDSEEGR